MALGKRPLEFQCPHCGALRLHEVVKTWRGHFGLNPRDAPVVRKLLGHPVLYRCRIKACSKCLREFSTGEVASDGLQALASLLVKVVAERDRLLGEVAALESNSQKLQEAIEAAASALSIVGQGRPQRLKLAKA
jgi:hypothetical protein